MTVGGGNGACPAGRVLKKLEYHSRRLPARRKQLTLVRETLYNHLIGGLNICSAYVSVDRVLHLIVARFIERAEIEPKAKSTKRN